MLPGHICNHIFFIMKGVVEIYIEAGGKKSIVLDYLGKGSVIGQYSVLGKEKTLFGMRVVSAGTTSMMCLDRDTFKSMRRKRADVDQALLTAEDFIEK